MTCSTGLSARMSRVVVSTFTTFDDWPIAEVEVLTHNNP